MAGDNGRFWHCLGMQNWELTWYETNHIKIGSAVLARDATKIWGRIQGKNYKPRENDISRVHRGTLLWDDCYEFGIWDRQCNHLRQILC